MVVGCDLDGGRRLAVAGDEGEGGGEAEGDDRCVVSFHVGISVAAEGCGGAREKACLDGARLGGIVWGEDQRTLRVRPMRRRRLSICRPFLDFMRARKPNFRARLILLTRLG